MKVKEQLATLFKLPIEKQYQEETEVALVKEFYKTEWFMGIVVLCFQAVMMIASVIRGGLFTYLRKDLYFYLYVSLFIITMIFLMLIIYLHKKEDINVRLHENVTLIYYFILCFWSCGITMLDQRSGTGITVFSYICMAAAVFNTLKPWKSVVLFVTTYLFLNILTILFQHNTLFFEVPPRLFSISMNSFFVITLAIITSVMLYRYRLLHHYNQIMIHKQYNDIYTMNKVLNHLAMTDQLTQLGNRRYLEEKILSLIDKDKITPLTIAGMMIDIDFFKQYNDLYGHQSGDICLQQIAKTILVFAQEYNAFAVRYGGEEFFICLQNCSNVFEKADILRKEVENLHLTHDGSDIKKITISIGVSETDTIATLQQDKFIQQCDKALYKAKENGRNRVEMYIENNKKGT